MFAHWYGREKTSYCRNYKFSNELRDFFSEKRGLNETEAFLRKRGYRSLWDKGMDLVVEKKLSLDELCSVLTPDEEIGMASDTEGAGKIDDPYNKTLVV